MDRAIEDMYGNLICINLDYFNTFPRPIRARFNRTEITMIPKDNFNSWGYPLFADMIQMAGIHHCNFRVF